MWKIFIYCCYNSRVIWPTHLKCLLNTICVKCVQKNYTGVQPLSSKCIDIFSITVSKYFSVFSYESSGYDYSAPSPSNTFTSYRQVYTSPFNQSRGGNTSGNVSNVSYHSETEITPASASGNDSSIEAGPSFNESLQRFKTASGHNQQMASWKNQMSSSRQSQSSSVQRRVEETRTMITQSSQKSYHLE